MGMVLKSKKMPSRWLLTCAAVVLLCAALAEGQEPQTKIAPQPQSLDYAGIYELKQIAPDLTGSGVKFGVICRSITYIDGKPQNDYQPNIRHNCFKQNMFNFHDEAKLPAGLSPHSTAICSILFGEDPEGFNPQLGQFRYQGVVPQAQADVYEFWHFLINNVFPHSPPDADILTTSIGNQVENWWTRGIESLAQHHGIIVVAGVGNGLNAYDPPLYPGAGSNIIGVGVVDSVSSEDLAINLANFSLARPEHSSFGPTADNRCKPDIVAPGNCMAAKAGDHNAYEPTGSWSSFSTPIVAGTIGLLVQRAWDDPNLSSAVSTKGGICVMKAILMNSATKLPYWHKGRLEKDDDHQVPLDYVQGAGVLNAVGAYKQLTAGQKEPGDCPDTGWDLNKLQKSEASQNTYKITLTEPAGKAITITAVWTRHYSSTYPFEPEPEKDTNFRLELWAIDHNDPNKDYLLDYSDSNTDNVEHIYCPAEPNYSNYEIVLADNAIDTPNETTATQHYGLAWNVTTMKNTDNISWYDLNADGIVNELDFTILTDNMQTGVTTPQRYLFGDIDANGTIDANDARIFFDHINTQADWHKEQD